MTHLKPNFTRSHRLSLFLVLLFLFIVVGCGPANETEPTATPTDTSEELAPSPEATASDAYPAQNTPESAPAVDDAYPPPSPTAIVQGAYPAPTPERQDGILLALDKPIQAGDTTISGVGPPNLPVYILNVTFMGEEMGSGVIGEDGTFSIAVDPVPTGIRLGLTATIEEIGLMENDVRPGDNAINIPQVGYFYDSFVIPQS